MLRHLRITDLPGNDVARRFEGREHGANVSFFLTRFPPGGGPVLHRHPYEETFVVEEGAATFWVGDKTVEARGGDVLVAPPGVPHRFVNPGPGVLRLISIQPTREMMQESLDGPGAS